MSSIVPSYVKQLKPSTINNHTLTDQEYADFQNLRYFLYLVTDLNGRIVTLSTGEFVFGTH